MEIKFRTYAERLASKTEEYVRENGKLFEKAKSYAKEQAKFGTFPNINGKYPEPDLHETKFNGYSIEEAFIQGACWKADELMVLVKEWFEKDEKDKSFADLERYVGQQEYKNDTRWTEVIC